MAAGKVPDDGDLLSVSGSTAWRVGGTASIFAAARGLIAAVRALRAEEDAGRQELVLASVISRRDAYLGALAAISGGALNPPDRGPAAAHKFGGPPPSTRVGTRGA